MIPDGTLKTLIALLCLVAVCPAARAQQPHVRLVHPYKPVVETSRSVNYVSGNTCRGCTLTANGKAVKVYPTGGFAIQVDLRDADSTVAFRATNASGASATRSITFRYRPPVAETAVSDFKIASVTTYPSGDCWLAPGDVIRFRVKAQPGNTVTLDNKTTLYEQPPEAQGGVAGIYQGFHVVEPYDPMMKKAAIITLKGPGGKTASYSVSPAFRVLDPSEPLVGETVGAFPYLEFGLGEDRLGGAKISYLDTAVELHITGKLDGDYRVRLAPGHTAYIPAGSVLLLSRGTFPPKSLTGSWRVWGDDRYDYVSIGLSAKLPYTTFQQTDPSRIVLDIYGATSNTNWITQLSSAREVKTVTYEQVSDGVFRVYITLRHPQIWGYRVAYRGDNLTVSIKRQKNPLTLSHMTIAIDPGHGGTNRGAQGPTGVFEKTVTLQIADRLATLVKATGARVVMTRTTDVSKDMIQRRDFLREADPDLLVSIHLNSSADPIHVSGTSTYYRYIGFRPLSQAILKHMEALGLAEYGNVGRFNFSLNGPTGYPNALVETVFLSNPADEARVLTPAFQQKIAQAILAGIRDFLAEAAGSSTHTR
jgi:N-acetylmuramoyl-L-alanine amidase